MIIGKGKRILIMGPPGSGKTYVSSKLQEKGIAQAVDADLIPDLGTWVDKKGKKVQFNRNADSKWLNEHKFIWDRKVLEKYLTDKKDDVYIFGISENIYDLLDLFDIKFYLKATPKLILQRFSQPGRKNPMGRKPEQLQRIMKSILYYTRKAKKFGFVFIDASKSPEEIYKEILNSTGHNDHTGL